MRQLILKIAASALAFALAFTPVRAAEQASYVTPIVGPMNMSTLAGTHLNPALRAIAACHNGASAPANGPSNLPLAYQCWVDTTANPSLYKLYDGASWITLGSINTTTHVWLPYLTGGTSGGVPYFSTAGIMGSSAALAQYGFVIGGGAGAAPATITACTDNQVPFGVTAGNPVCRSVTGDVTFATGVATIGASKVVNSQLATMAANTTKCNATAGTANPTDCSAATMQTNLGLVIGTNVQAYDAELAAIAGLTSAADKCFYWTGAGTAGNFDCTSFGRSVANAADAAALRTLAGAAIGTNVEAWDADLDALAANSTDGFWAHTGAGTGAARIFTAPAAGFTITNPAGIAGNPTFVLANDLGALEALASSGFAVRTNADTWAQRSIAGTANEVCVTNGDGVAGNPTLGICSGFLSTAHSWPGAQAFVSPTSTGTFDVQEAVKLSGDISPTQIAANTNDWAPTGFSTASTVRLSTDASRNITGLAGGADGRIIILHNVGSFSAVLTNEDILSTTANRFLFGGDMTLATNTSVTLRYDATSSRWRAITSPGAGGGGGGTVTSAGIAAGGGITVSGTCTITSSGTCTVSQRAPTIQVLPSGTGATYTTPSGVSHIRVKGCAGGGGGGGSGTGTSGGNGGNGNTTSFSASTMSATGGVGSNATSGASAAGGTGTNGQINYAGNGGTGTFTVNSGFIPRISGAASPLFGPAGGAGGASGTMVGSGSNGGSGGAGGCFERIIASPAATYTYTIGTGGTGGAAGTSGSVGIAGADGLIVVEEF